MTKVPHILCSSMSGATQFAPLVALGCYVRSLDLFAPLWARLSFPQPTHTVHPQMALLEVWVSLLAGCRSIKQVNSKIRPDEVLAQAWGCSRFAEQSTLARVLDACQVEQVQQFREGSRAIYRWIGAAPRHAWDHPLLIDIDLTHLPSGVKTQGATKGYASGKKGALGGSYVGWVPPNTMRTSPPCSIRATCSVIKACLPPFRPWKRLCLSPGRSGVRPSCG
jgi:hypothetical protein